MSNGRDYSSPRQTLLSRGLKPRKRHGQHFLVDARVAARTAEALGDSAYAIEIGGGTGTLTEALARVAAQLDVLEIDAGLCRILRERFAAQARVRILECDALDFDFAAALRAHRRPRAMCGNLPYNITTPLLERILRCAGEWDRAVIMVQREYGRRLTAKPATRDYSSLTLFARHYCDIEKLFDVGAAGFYPPPKVASTLVRLTPRPARTAKLRDEALLLWLIRAAFAQRRKLLAKSVAAGVGRADARRLVDEAVLAARIPPKARAEQLDYDDFLRLANVMSAAGIKTPPAR